MSAVAATTDLQKNVSGAEANVVIGIRTRVVAIQIENASVRRVVPIPTAEEATFNVMYPKYLFAYRLYPTTDHTADFVYHGRPVSILIYR